MEGPKGDNHGSTPEEKRLELRLGPPCDHDWGLSREGEGSVRSLGYPSDVRSVENGWVSGAQNHNQKYFFPSRKPQGGVQYPPHSLPVRGQEPSQLCNARTADNPYTPSSSNTAVPNSSQKRSAPAPVVGWPPIRSFRKNLASTSASKPIPEPGNAAPNKTVSAKPVENSPTHMGFLVKVNMDGILIGRKVDLRINDSYEKLSSAVNELFRDLLAAQRDSSAVDTLKKQEGEKGIIKGLEGGVGGEYTLVYEDNEGDRMLVGDVPWHMFVSTVKRLRVLKTSDLSTLRVGGKHDTTISPNAASK